MDSRQIPLVRRLGPRQWVAIDYAVAAAMLLAYLGSNALATPDGVPRWLSAAVIAIAVLPAASRRRWPRGVLAVVVIGSAVATAISPSPVLALAPAYVMYLIPLRFPSRDALRLLAGALLVTAAGLAVFATARHGIYGPGGTGDAGRALLESGLLIVVAWLAGYSVRQQRAHAASQREQAERQARERLAEARRASSEERLRIARELHDVIAHTLSLITVQAGVANYLVREQPEQAARALSSIEETSRGALTEMRALLGVLRADEADVHGDAHPAAHGAVHGAVGGRYEGGGLMPTPGLADLRTLAERTAEAGVQVDLDVRGALPVLSAGLDLAAYRVIQEAVTNVIKHAAADRCSVTVVCRESTLTIEITDHGTGRDGAGDGAGGHGIAGMRERVSMYGGEFNAAPLPGRGFRVTARFPLAGAGAGAVA